jgi:hypothetical protein
LYDEFFCSVPGIGREIRFRFDYAALSRWLLKLAFNTARSRNWTGRLLDLLRQSVPFIRGLSEQTDIWTTLYVLSPVPPTLLSKAGAPDSRDFSKLELRRIMRLYGESFDAFQIGMNHYQFRVFLGETTLNRKDRNSFRKRILGFVPGSCLLTERASEVRIFPSKWTILDEADRSSALRRNMREGARLVQMKGMQKCIP